MQFLMFENTDGVRRLYTSAEYILKHFAYVKNQTPKLFLVCCTHSLFQSPGK